MQVGRVLVATALGSALLALLGLGCSDTARAIETGRGGGLVNVGTPATPLRLWVEDRGSGQPILLIHGLGANTYSWRWLAPALAGTHRVISVDLNGRSQSDPTRDGTAPDPDRQHRLSAACAPVHRTAADPRVG
jgi:pimeloyl-ACP methyl ester carboxylesterase